MVKLLMCR